MDVGRVIFLERWMQKKARMLWLWCLGWVLGLVGCYREAIIPDFPLEVRATPREAPNSVRLSFFERDAAVVSDTLKATLYALRENQRWTTLEAPLHLRIFPTHRSLEEALQLRLPWVRAWARYGDIWLQSPRTWRRQFYQWPLTELLTHEIAHVAMFQMCCEQKDWDNRSIPLWFREGMASVTAQQGYVRLSVERLASFFASPQGKRVWRALESVEALRFYQNELYSLGHWLFDELQQRIKQEGVSRLLRSMRTGNTFEQAFVQQVGSSVQGFLDDFARKYLQAASLSLFRYPLPPVFKETPRSVRSASVFSTHGACSLHPTTREGNLPAVHLRP